MTLGSLLTILTTCHCQFSHQYLDSHTSLLWGVLPCPAQLIFSLILIGPKDPWFLPDLTTKELCLLLWILWVLNSHFWCVCQKCCPSWELNPGPSAFSALPTELPRQLRIKCSQCHTVLLVSDSLSPIHQVCTPSDTQHAFFALCWAPQCTTCWLLLCLLVIVFCDCKKTVNHYQL